MSSSLQHTLQNESLRISVREIGAELCEITSLTSGKGYLWGADPAIWANYAPILFPIIGELKEGTYEYRNNQYHLPRHGIVRNNPKVKLSDKTDTSLSFSLEYDEDSLLAYPFRFRLTVTYALDNSRIIVEFKVENLDTSPLYFSLGGHPAFCIPRSEQEKYGDYYLEFEKEETVSRWLLTDKGLLSGETEPVLFNSAILPLSHSLFEKDALVFKDIKSRKVSLKSKTSAEVLSVSYEDFPFLGIWAKPQGDFVCIEPWQGVADSATSDQKLENKEGIIALGAQENYTTAYIIEVIDQETTD